MNRLAEIRKKINTTKAQISPMGELGLEINGISMGSRLDDPRFLDKHAGYVGWTPVECFVGFIFPPSHDEDAQVRLKIRSGSDGGHLLLYSEKPSPSDMNNGVEELTFKLNGSKVETSFKKFYLAGKFGYPGTKKHSEVSNWSTTNGSFISVYLEGNPRPDIRVPLMVRVRKNANELSQFEIDRFLRAFVELNDKSPRGQYPDKDPEGNPFIRKPKSLLDELVLMHTVDAAYEIHMREAFHPWHRMFLVHLERELQEIDPDITMPYWKFDEAAPRVFSERFVGVPKVKHSLADDTGKRLGSSLILHKENPLVGFVENTIWGELRRGYFTEFDENTGEWKDIPVDPAKTGHPRIKAEKEVLSHATEFYAWCMFEERNSHNPGHDTFNGQVTDIGRDPIDPLFFLLHTNVDRLWARWQLMHDRFNPKVEATYNIYNDPNPQIRATPTDITDKKRQEQFLDDRKGRPDEIYYLGNRVEDLLWPWEWDFYGPRPNRHDKTNWYKDKWSYFPQIRTRLPRLRGNYRWGDTEWNETFNPGPPRVIDTIDYQGRHTDDHPIGFEYADVPYFNSEAVFERESERPAKLNNRQLNERFFAAETKLEEQLELADQMYEIEPDFKEFAIGLLTNTKREISLREKIMWLINEDSPSYLSTVLNDILANKEEVPTMRYAAMHFLRTAKRSFISYPAIQAAFKQVLKSIMTNENDIMPNRVQAIEILAANEDSFLEGELKDGAQSKGQIVLSASDSVSLLRSYDKKDTAFFKQIIESETDESTKGQAVLGLSHAIEEEGYLQEILESEASSSSTKKAAVLAMHSVNRKKVYQYAIKYLQGMSQQPETLERSANNVEGEADFNATLMNILLYSGDYNALKKEGTLKESLKGLSSTSGSQRLVADRAALDEDADMDSAHSAFLNMAGKLQAILEDQPE